MDLPLRIIVHATALVAVLSMPGGVEGQGFATFYPDSTLSRLQRVYPENIQWNFDNVVLRQLRPEERTRVEGVRLQFPVTDARNDPLGYYSMMADGRQTISISIMSLKFLDDVGVAHAWLDHSGYSPETVLDYLNVLKYRPTQSSGGRFPPLFATLGIPSNATTDPETDDVANKILKSSVVFLLAHEVGHLYHRHPGYGPGVTAERAQANEVQADSFAIEVFRRLGIAPVGVAYLFEVAARLGPNRGDFPSDEAWREYLKSKATHPLTGSRLQQVSRQLRRSPDDFIKYETNATIALARVRLVADQLDGIGKLFDDPQLQRFQQIRGVQIPLAELRPRKPGAPWIPR